MAINIDSWDTNEANNNTIEGEDIGEGCEPAGLNNWARKICAAIRAFRDKSYCIDKNTTIAASGGAAPSSPAVGHLWMEY